MRRVRTLAALGGVILATAAAARATVVSNNGVYFAAGDFSMFNNANHQIGVAQGFGASTIDTSTWFRLSSVVSGESTFYGLAATTHNLDEGSDWYVVPANAAFTPATIAAGNFTPLVVGNAFSPATFVGSNSTFYLGFDTGYGMPGRGQTLGWLRIRHTSGTLTLLGTGVAYGEPGIIVGSTTVIPEPATGVTVVAACMLLGRRRWAITPR